MTPSQIKSTQDKVNKELKEGTYAGYCGDSEFLDYNWDTFKHWCKGQILIAIGEGALDRAIYSILTYGAAREQYYSKKSQLEKRYGLHE
jgi:hypothetical protein